MGFDRWLGVEIRHLAALQAISEAGSFRRAADRLGYTQSAVSQQIATLEKIVGERLVERPGGPRPASLTQAGELLLRHAKAVVARLQAAEADLAAFSDGAGGALRVGAYQSAGAKILPMLLGRFAELWPRVDLQLCESTSDAELLTAVERGELDLAFSVYPLPEGPFGAVELMRDPYTIVVRADSPLVDRPGPLGLEDVADLPLVGFRQCRCAVEVEARLRALGREPNIVFRSDDNGTVQGMVAAGVGAALMPRLTVDLSDERVRVLDAPHDLPPRLIVLCWHRDRYRSPSARAFVELAHEVCDELAEPLDPVAVSAA